MPDHLHKILSHYSRAYNVRWQTGAQDAKGKAVSSYKCVRNALPDNLFIEHFQGKTPIGVQPILDDGESCQWGCIDIDSYGDPSLVANVRKMAELFGIPAFIEASKSGGAHVYLILDRPTKIAPFRKALKKLAVWMGYPKAEIRPAQDRLSFAEGDLGSFIILPGFGIGVETAKELLEGCIVPLQDFNKITQEGDYIDGPPCLFPLERVFESSGNWENRNMYLYQLAIFMKYKYPTDWRDKIGEYNDTRVEPKLPAKEISAMLDQIERQKNSHYQCNKAPFDSVCNKGACQQRKFGIAAKEGLSSILSAEGITVLDTDPPVWFVNMSHPTSGEAVRVKLNTDQLQNVLKFKKRCMEVLKIVPVLPRQQDWEAVVSGLLQNAEVIPVPFDMTEHARILESLWKFCLASRKRELPEVLLDGGIMTRPYEKGIIATFRLVDFVNYLENHGNRASVSDVYASLSELERSGKVSRAQVEIPPMVVETWTTYIESRYLQIKDQIDKEVEDGHDS
jgi:hypothetical protein